MEIPGRLQEYPCSDYFQSELSEQGYWDESAQIWLIVAADEAEEQPEIGFLAIGRAGVDGIDFGYRKGEPGFWAYHPMESEFQLLAPTVQEFLAGWCSGSISV
jgi:hypothetical protein